MTEMDQRAVTPTHTLEELRVELGEFLQRVDALHLEADLHGEVTRSARVVVGRHLDRVKDGLMSALLGVAVWPHLADIEAGKA